MLNVRASAQAMDLRSSLISGAAAGVVYEGRRMVRRMAEESQRLEALAPARKVVVQPRAKAWAFFWSFAKLEAQQVSAIRSRGAVPGVGPFPLGASVCGGGEGHSWRCSANNGINRTPETLLSSGRVVVIGNSIANCSAVRGAGYHRR